MLNTVIIGMTRSTTSLHDIYTVAQKWLLATARHKNATLANDFVIGSSIFKIL